MKYNDHLICNFLAENFQEIVELFHLPPNVKEEQIYELIDMASKKSSICIPKPKIEWPNVRDRTYCYLYFIQSEVEKVLYAFEYMGFPYIRKPFQPKLGLFNGKFNHLTFCPPLSHINCFIVTFFWEVFKIYNFFLARKARTKLFI